MPISSKFFCRSCTLSFDNKKNSIQSFSFFSSLIILLLFQVKISLRKFSFFLRKEKSYPFFRQFFLSGNVEASRLQSALCLQLYNESYETFVLALGKMGTKTVS